MLKYKLEKTEVEGKTYIYFPEGNEDAPGIVFLGEDGKNKVLEESARDFKQMYAMHALSGIDKSKEDGVVAWY